MPLSAFVSPDARAAAPQKLNRFDRLRAITIQGSLAPGVSIGQGLETLEQIVRDELPPEVRIGYQGQSKEFKDASSAIYVTFGLALLVVFLVLGGAVRELDQPAHHHADGAARRHRRPAGALCLTGQSLNIYSQIGMILLIGLMTKNGILIVEFANQLRERGLDDARGGDRILGAAPAADPDDLDRDDGRRHPARLVDRRRRGGAQRHRLGHRRRRRRSRPC